MRTHPLTSACATQSMRAFGWTFWTHAVNLSALTYEQAYNIPGRHLLKLIVIVPYWFKKLSCKVVQLRIQVSQGSVATDLRWGGRFNTTFLSSRSENTTVKELLGRSTFTKVIAKKRGTLFGDSVYWNKPSTCQIPSKLLQRNRAPCCLKLFLRIKGYRGLRYDMIRYDSVYLTWSKKLTGSQE